MRALDFLGVPFALTRHVGVEMSFLRPPRIRRKTGEPEGLQQRLELHKDFVFAVAKDRGQDLACVVIDGVPQPALVAFLADKAPHLVDLRFPSLLNVHKDLGWVYGAQQRAIDRCQCGFFFSRVANLTRESILKFFQDDNAGMLRMTSSARYFKE